MSATLTVTTKTLPSAIRHLVSKNLIPFVTSAPGVGKSSIVVQTAQALAEEQDLNYYQFACNNFHPQKEMEAGFGLIDMRANMMTTLDLYGLPTFTEDKESYIFARPDMLPKHGQGIIFVDELPQASQSTMGGFSEAFLEHRIGRHIIPKGWKFVVAGNRQKDRADAHKIPTHIKGRMTELPLEFSLDGYIEWAVQNDIHGAAIAFAKYRPALLDSFDPKLETNCTPRSLTFAAEHVDAPNDIRFQLIAGDIGEGPAIEFEGFIKKYTQLPDPDYIKNNPTKAPVPDELDVLYAVTTMLGMHSDEKTFAHYMKYIKRIDRPEFQVAFVKQAMMRDAAIINTKAFNDFSVKNRDLLMG